MNYQIQTTAQARDSPPKSVSEASDTSPLTSRPPGKVASSSLAERACDGAVSVLGSAAVPAVASAGAFVVVFVFAAVVGSFGHLRSWLRRLSGRRRLARCCRCGLGLGRGLGLKGGLPLKLKIKPSDWQLLLVGESSLLRLQLRKFSGETGLS